MQEAVTLKGKFRRMYFSLVILLIRCFYFLCARLLPKNGSRVLFMTETKDILWGNLKYIHDRMLERGLDSRFKLTCSCRKSVGSRKSVLSWIKTVLLIAASDYIFIDDYAPVFGFFKLYPKSKLIQYGMPARALSPSDTAVLAGTVLLFLPAPAIKPTPGL